MKLSFAGRFAGLMGAFALCAVFVPGAASASGSNTGHLTVNASVAQNCTVADSTLTFTGYDPVVTNNTAGLDSSATVTLTCTLGATGVSLCFDAGQNGSHAVGTSRAMKSGSSYLSYDLYSDSPPTTVWTACTTSGGVSETVSGGITTPTNVTVYGQVPGGQDVPVGSGYTDDVTETVNF